MTPSNCGWRSCTQKAKVCVVALRDKGADTDTHTDTRIHTHTHRHTHTQAHTHTHRHTHTGTHSAPVLVVANAAEDEQKRCCNHSARNICHEVVCGGGRPVEQRGVDVGDKEVTIAAEGNGCRVRNVDEHEAWQE